VALTALVNSLVNHLHAKEAGSPGPTPSEPSTTAAPAPGPQVAPSVADAVAPKRRGRRRVTVGNQAPAVPAVIVGNPVPVATPVEPSKGADAPVPEQSPSTTSNTRTLPLNVKLGRGVTVGTKTGINTGVTVGSAPVAPPGVTVGGRPRKV
jgi:hypothetical protein